MFGGMCGDIIRMAQQPLSLNYKSSRQLWIKGERGPGGPSTACKFVMYMRAEKTITLILIFK